MKLLKSLAPLAFILLLLCVAIWPRPMTGEAAAQDSALTEIKRVLDDNHCDHPDLPPVVGASVGPRRDKASRTTAADAPASSDSTSAPSLSAAAGVTFIAGFLRCPPGNPSNPNCSDISQWIGTDQGVAYYRDVIVATTVFAEGTHNGETWEIVFTRPDGTQAAGGPITYFTNGDCFQVGFQVLCGANTATLYWYFNSQCNQVGQWRADLKHDGVIVDTSPFFIRPRLGVALNNWNQNDYTTPFDTMCRDAAGKFVACSNPLALGQTTVSIQEMGCTLTSIATMLNYHGVPADPVTLDQWLIANNAYDGDKCPGCIKDVSTAIPKYAKSKGKTLKWVRRDTDPAKLYNNVCKYGPIPIRVKNDTHTVTASGRDDALTTYTFMDPNGGVDRVLTDAGFNNTFTWQLVFSGPEQTFTDQFNMSFKFFSPVEAFVVDPLGRRQGLDPRTGTTYNEIPDASYGPFGTVGPTPSDYESPKWLDLPRPAEGEHTITVVGTGNGTYDARFTVADNDLNTADEELTAVPISAGEVHIYKVNFSRAAGAQVRLAGGFDGGGQRPRDVNKFLSYSRPGDSPASLPVGATSYSMLIFYDQNILPATFSATLNGVDVTSAFNPQPGGKEAVTLNLASGRNVLQLSVSGQLGSRTPTDSDRLIFEVP